MTSGPTGHVSAGHGASAPDACSTLFDEKGISAFGTAARAGFWLAVEQTGPWGRSAATESHLPTEVGRRLDEDCASRGGRLALLREPGPHADAHHPGGRTAYLAFSGPQPWLLMAPATSLEALLEVDFDAVAAGDREAAAASLPGASAADPVLLVCTNGRRDVCCAIRGRPVALEAAQAAPGRVWESSHTGGHRFAPTGVLLPHGVTLARLDAALCAEVLESALAGQVPARALGPLHDRGRSALAPALQAAESFVRHEIGETSLDALASRELADPARGTDAEVTQPEVTEAEVTHAEVTHADGRRWLVEAGLEATGETLPESCAKLAVATRQWHLRRL